MSMEENSCYNEIVNKTTGEIRTFLSELANGTSHYKSLHNLTEQIEHQYHGRFLIELIQNAHDVLFEEKVEGDKGRVELLLRETRNHTVRSMWRMTVTLSLHQISSAWRTSDERQRPRKIDRQQRDRVQKCPRNLQRARDIFTWAQSKRYL